MKIRSAESRPVASLLRREKDSAGHYRLSWLQLTQMKHLLLAIFIVATISSSNLLAQSPLDFRKDDTVRSLLMRQVGKSVELRMRSGEKIAGKLETVGDKLLQLSQLAGAEFYDAAIEIDSISAVVVRAKSN